MAATSWSSRTTPTFAWGCGCCSSRGGTASRKHPAERSTSPTFATTVAFCTSVVVNFLLNRTAMSSWGSRGLRQHALRYGSLVVANYVITLAVVTTAGDVSARYLVAKLAIVAGSTSWNFLLYRHWVFTPPRPNVAEAGSGAVDREEAASS